MDTIALLAIPDGPCDAIDNYCGDWKRERDKRVAEIDAASANCRTATPLNHSLRVVGTKLKKNWQNISPACVLIRHCQSPMESPGIFQP